MSFKNAIIQYSQKRADEFTAHPLNPRLHPQHQRDVINSSLNRFGWVSPVIVNIRTGNLIDGHERVWQALSQGDDTLVPYIEVDIDEDKEAELILSYDKSTLLAEYDPVNLQALMEQVNTDDEVLAKLFAEMKEEYIPIEMPHERKVATRRTMPLDLIYTFGGSGDASCCMAVNAGWKFGTQSPQTPCERTPSPDSNAHHKLIFIDNDWYEYDHRKHLEFVKTYRPKYCTVLDILTDLQARKAKVKTHASFEQIIDWAHELSEYAENVIVIPKYDCLDKIPDKFMLGYSVPTSHGGTPMPLEMFQGRRVHLLGGSWKKQLECMMVLGDDCVSIDNNYVHKMATYGQWCDGDGNTHTIQDLGIPVGAITNPLFCAITLSFGHIASKVQQLHLSEEQTV